VGCLGGGYNRSVGDKREVDTRVRYKVGLEFIEIDIERAIEAKRSSNRGNN
jgi:hypothetical protein